MKNSLFHIARLFYTWLLYFSIPFILMRLYWKGRHAPHAYRHRIKERFAWGCLSNKKADIWIHAVSLGEVIAVAPLVEHLLKTKQSVLLTTMTPTGSQEVISRFGTRVKHTYIPYDLPCLLKRFFKAIQVNIGIIMETELWPNMIWQAKSFDIPLILANARISNKAFHQYLYFKWFFTPILNQFTKILAQSAQDAKRFKSLGAEAKRVQIAGNIKFDLAVTNYAQEEYQQIKYLWGVDRPVLVLASTHTDEEEQLLKRLHKLRIHIPNLCILIAPRHPERFQSVYKLSQSLNWKTALKSHPKAITKDVDVIVIDAMGELLAVYQVSDYAFVGGSLVPVGGHNLLEPIAMSTPVLTGPYTQNCKTICKDLYEAGAIQWVKNADTLVEALINLHQHPEQRVSQVIKATEILEANKGSLVMHLRAIEGLN